MDAINTLLNVNQNSAEMFKTKYEVDQINKKLKVDGKEPVKDLGKDQFLKLLITELQHQDPTNPMEDREFIAQMAQFSSLEQMMNFNSNMEKLLERVSFQSSFNMLGLNVDIDSQGNFDSEGNPLFISGTVEAVSRQGEEIFVKVNGENYPASNIVKVGN
ncbi:MAG: flagellar hook assembly protein FlgD [Candidatus Lokiarchaeota archaeon]|nr:flagellar hook assembly protein FlgD [Candidatus Lokiarchaeota archaeon]